MFCSCVLEFDGRRDEGIFISEEQTGYDFLLILWQFFENFSIVLSDYFIDLIRHVLLNKKVEEK